MALAILFVYVREIKLTEKPNPRSQKTIDSNAEDHLYTPVSGRKAQLRLRRTRVLKLNLGFLNGLIPPRRFGGGMGVQRDVGGNPNIPPSSFWA